MDPTIPTPTASSTVTNSDVSSSMPTFYVLDISLISAQDLAHVSKSMRTYAITWIHPSRKLTSRVDQQSHKNPLWNDRFAFRVDSDFLESDQAEVTVEIYTVSWFRDVLVGTVKVLISDLITPSARNGTRYVALQVRRPSGNPQGILNMGVSLMDATNRSMHLLGEINPLIVDYQDELAKKMNRKASLKDKLGDDDNLYDDMADEVNEKVHLWRAYNAGITEFNDKEGSMVNGSSMCNGEAGMGSELCSDVGPSASVVAAEIARHSLPPLAEKSQTAHPPSKAKADPHKNNNVEDFGSSIVEEMTVEEATAKGLKANSGILKKKCRFHLNRAEKWIEANRTQDNIREGIRMEGCFLALGMHMVSSSGLYVEQVIMVTSQILARAADLVPKGGLWAARQIQLRPLIGLTTQIKYSVCVCVCD